MVRDDNGEVNESPDWGQPGSERCEQCGRSDVDEQWLWLEVQRPAEEEDCEFDSVELVFCTQAHAGAFFAESEIDWQRSPLDVASGVRADRFFFGCGLLAIILSVIGLIALLRWLL